MNESNDHDLLIRLSAGFESFEKTTHRSLFEINKGVERMGVSLEQKADKADIRVLQDNINGIDKRVLDVEKEMRDIKIRKQTIVQLGDMGAKGWAMFIGAMSVTVSIINSILK
jgi:PBP1b-binding outer membrane lipoprotein LpoB